MISNVETSKKNFSYLILGLAALIIRIPYLNQSLWLDEAIQADASSHFSLLHVFTNFLPGDFNPPLFYVFTWLSIHLFGNNEIALRLPSVLAGVGLVLFCYKFLNLTIKDKLLAFGGGMLVATAPLLVYYSQEGRTYELAAATVVWSMLSFYELFILKKNVFWQYFLATGLTFLSHYTAWLIYPTQLLILFLINKKTIGNKKNILMLVSPLVWIVPLIPLLVSQLRLGMTVSAALPVWRELSSFSVKQLLLIPAKILVGRLPLSDSFINILIIGIPLLLWLSVIIWVNLKEMILSWDFKQLKQHYVFQILILWLIFPVVIGSLLSFKLATFSYFRFLFIAPAFYLLLVFSAASLPKILSRYVVIFFLMINLSATGLYLLDSNFHREDWGSLVSYVNSNGISNRVLILGSVKQPFEYYNKGALKTVDYSDIAVIKYEKAVWLVKYSQPIFEPDNRTEEALKRFGFEEIEEKQFRGDLVIKLYVNATGLTASL